MRRRPRLLLLALAGSLCLAGCGGSGTKAPVQTLDDWLRSWRGEVRTGQRPNDFTVPTPPAFQLPSAAERLGRDVDSAASELSDDLVLAYEETKGVLCTWFGWYLETGKVVPTAEEFPALLLQYGFGRASTAPSQRFREAAELFRDAIESARSEEEQVRNAAAAAACI